MRIKIICNFANIIVSRNVKIWCRVHQSKSETGTRHTPTHTHIGTLARFNRKMNIKPNRVMSRREREQLKIREQMQKIQ